MTNLALKDWIVIAISFVTLMTVFYKDFLKGSDLKTVISTIVFVKAAENNKAVILEQILLNDLLSGRPSQQALRFIRDRPELAEAIKNSDREQTRVRMANYAMQMSNAGTKLTYDATLETLTPFFGDKNIALSFYVPLNIINIGRKTGDITSLILIVKSKDNKDLKWVFNCFAEIRAEEFMKQVPNQPMGTTIGKLFPGISIGPASNYRLDAHLIPMDVVKNRIISTTSIVPGKYTVQVVGFNSENKKCLESNEAALDVNAKMLVDVFNGSTIAINLSAEGNIEKMLN